KRGPPKRAPARQADSSGLRGGGVAAARRGLAAVAAIPDAPFLHAQVVLHMPDAREVLDAVFGAALLLTARDGPVERDFAIGDRDRNLARVDVPVVGQRVAGVFPDAFVGTRVAGRALPTITLPAITGAAIAALAAAVVVIIVGKPAGDGLGRAVEPIALVVRAPGPAIVTVLAARRRAVI